MILETIGYVLTLFIIAGTFLWVIDRISDYRWKKNNPPEKLKALQEAYDKRLLHPNWTFYEKHLKRPIPDELIKLYNNKDLILSEVGELNEIYINNFTPIDEDGLNETKEWLTEELVSFATADGDQIYLRPGENEKNTVYITYHDSGETEVLFTDISEMFKAIKEKA